MWSLKTDTTYKFTNVAVTSVQIGGRSYRVDDAPVPRGDGISFGEDFSDPGDVKLELLINFQSTRNLGIALMKLDEASQMFLSRWDAAALRGKAGALGELVIPRIGMVEGRPRRAEFDYSTYNLGYMYGTATFVRATNDLYVVNAAGSAPWQQVTLQMVPAQVGGIKDPLKSPLRTSAESSRAAPVTVSGGVAYPIYELKGPIQSDAQLEVPGRWKIRLNRGLTEYETARIDTRPGRAATYLNGIARQLLDPRSSMLSECTLLQGSNILSLRGASIEGTASVTARWRETKAGI